MVVRIKYTEDFGRKSVGVMELGNKAMRALHGKNIRTMEELMNNWDKIAFIKGVGEKTVKEIKVAFMKVYGDSLDEEQQIEFLRRLAEDNTPGAKGMAV